MLAGNVVDEVVDPGRPIPPASTQFHGLTDADVGGARRIATVGRDFHAFAQGAVLVAHNTPFDTAFLRRAEAAIGLRFDNPVADTVAISAHLDPSAPHHTLDALCARYGVTIAPALRHTAIGDAVATAQVFARLIQIFHSRGIRTLGDLLAVTQRIKAISREQVKY
ncbi:MAG: DNA polymerase-3 subunit epsilon [Paracoccaceae bacterium]